MIKKSGLSMMVSENESRGEIGCQSTHAQPMMSSDV